jgi:hypothetical protein
MMLVVAVGCGGHEPAPTALHNQGGPAAPPFSVELARSQCMGMCPAYAVSLRDDGTVQWIGEANVAEKGARTARVDPAKVQALREAFRAARFMELDDTGHVPPKPVCHTRPDGSQECEAAGMTMCTDTSHAKLTVVLGGATHSTDDSHCGGEDALVKLEELVDATAGTGAWIGGGDPASGPSTP